MLLFTNQFNKVNDCSSDITAGILHRHKELYFQDNLRRHIHKIIQLTLSRRSSICTANQWTGFYVMGTSVIKTFKQLLNNKGPRTNPL